MDENLEFYKVYHKIIKLSWLITIILVVSLMLISIIFLQHEVWYKLSVSFLLGAMTNLMAFNLLKNNVLEVNDNSKKAISSTTTNYLIRLSIYAIVLFVSFQYPKLNPYVVASGFLTVRLAILLSSLKK